MYLNNSMWDQVIRSIWASYNAALEKYIIEWVITT